MKAVNKTTLLLPFIQKSKLVDTGIKNNPIPVLYDAVATQTPLVRGTFEYRVFEPLKAAGNDNLRKCTEDVLIVALQRVMEDATIAQCLTEKCKIEGRALEIANLKTAAIGVVLSSLTIDSVPVHLQLLVRITTMPYLIYWQIVEELQ